ncbi:MAG: serine/threonine-protein kinase [Isosphaeraceae bacterium]
MPSPADDSTLPPESGHDDESLLGKVQQILGQLGPVDTTHAPGDELPGGGDNGEGKPPAPSGAGEAPGPFDDYEILEMLGEGGMGIVYRAHQRSLNRFVAVKLLKTDVPAGPEALRRFQDEAKAVAHLDHPNIVPIFEVDSCDGEPYFTMKLVAGSSLNRRMKDYLDRPRDVAAMLRTLALAIQHAHDRGILHRDLKPHNVLLDEEGRPHVTDFGLALRLNGEDAQTRIGVAGTPRYMAPEQTLGRRDAITTATDVHGLGTILYALLTGSHPIDRNEDATLLDVLDEVRNRMPEPPSALNSAVPRDLEAICLKCLQKAPSGRYRSAAELAADLDRWLGGRPITARPVGAVERTWMWAWRNPLAAAGIAALILATSLIPKILLDRVRQRELELRAAQADLKTSRAEAAQERERAERPPRRAERRAAVPRQRSVA